MISAQLRAAEGGVLYWAEALGVIALGEAPVLKLCRMLVDAGHDPAEPMEVYRGEMLALRVRSIGEAARLRTGRVGFKGVANRRGRPQARFDDEALPDSPDDEEIAP